MPLPGTHALPSHAQIVTAFVATAPASTSAPLEVTIPAFGAERSVVLGWAPRATLPKVGDACLVAYDEGGNPWVIAWLNVGEAPLVTALPGSPYDGQVIAFQSATMATSGVIWRFRYRAASASAYKWEFVGGAAIEIGPVNEAVELNGVEEKEMAATVTLPLAGDYLLHGGMSFFGAVGVGGLNEGEVLVGKNGANTGSTLGKGAWNSVWEGGPIIGIAKMTGAAGDKIGIRVAGRQAVKSHALYPELQVMPVRVG